MIARRLKNILSKSISAEQFGFLEGRQIHEAIGVAQEGLHSMKTQKLEGAVIKIDLSKAYDWVNWLYIRMLMTHLGFGIDLIRWTMSCLTFVSFAILINGATTHFFKSHRGLRQGCPMSPLLFVLITEGLSRILAATVSNGELEGISISRNLKLTHLLFVDDILIYCNGTRGDTDCLVSSLSLFRVVMGMEINAGKSCIRGNLIPEENLQYLLTKFPSLMKILELESNIWVFT